MMIVKTRLLPPGACAFTFWPIIFVHPDVAEVPRVLLHEGTHLEQQRRWVVPGLLGAIASVVAGVLLGHPWWVVTIISVVVGLPWYSLYLLALPIGYNPCRKKWETEAMLAEGRTLEEIAQALKRAPYYLWIG